MAKTVAVALDDVILDERCQPRAVLNAEAVQEYAEVYQEDEVKLPALKVVDVDGSLILVDGFHRLAAARQAAYSFLRVEVLERCDIGRACWLAASMNQGQGVRRTNADKRQAVKLALESDIGVEASLRDIANHVGVHHSFVAKVKEELEATSFEDAPKTEPEPEASPHADDDSDRDIYHTAAVRIRGCYRKVCAILGEADDVCEALFVALEKAQAREL